MAADSEEARGSGRTSLVDSAEVVLRGWLASGRHRPGDRLPPEQQLAASLGVSRGTLRSALERLEETGEVVRRQGSGTFVGRLPDDAALHEGLERLEPYSSLARSRDIVLSARDVELAERPVDHRLAELFGVEMSARVLTVSRTVLADGVPAAVMEDTISPLVDAPEAEEIAEAVARGEMLLDILTGAGIPVARASTRIRARLVIEGEPAAQMLGLRRSTALLDLEQVYYLGSGLVSHASVDIFTREGLDLRVNRWTSSDLPGSGSAIPVLGQAGA